MEDEIMTSLQKQQEENRYLIAQNTCPVCFKSTSHTKDPYRSLKQHIILRVDKSHEFWYSVFWKWNYCKNGDRFIPRMKSAEEVEQLVEKYFGTPVLSRIKGTNITQTP